jgi:hypothetical protein
VEDLLSVHNNIKRKRMQQQQDKTRRRKRVLPETADNGNRMG